MATLHNIYEEYNTLTDDSFVEQLITLLENNIPFEGNDYYTKEQRRESAKRVIGLTITDLEKLSNRQAFLQFIDSEIERHEKDKKDEWNIQDEFIESNALYNQALEGSIIYLQEQRKLIGK